MGQALEPLTQGVLHTLLSLWPLWLLLLIPPLFQILLNIRRQRRLAKAGIGDIDRMDGITFECYLETLFRTLGYQAQRTRASGDFGADLIITKGGVRTIVQAKRYSKNAGVKAVQEVVAAQKMYNGAHAMVVTNNGYTKQAQRLAQANSVELWDRERLVTAILAAKQTKV